MHIFLRCAGLAAALVAAAACSSGSTSTSSSTGTSTGSTTSSSGSSGGESATAACAAEAQALCALRAACTTNGFDVDYVYGSAAVCATREAIGCTEALMASGTGQTAAHVAQCAAAYPTEACTDFYDSNPIAACVSPAGTNANGAACGANGQCSSTFCATGAYAVCGTCQALPVAGAQCQTQDDCGRDLACVKPAGSTAQDVGKCAAWVPLGGTCLTDVMPCASGLSCFDDDTTTGTTGKCKTSGSTVNAACDTDRITAPSCNFDLGLECVPTDGVKGAGTCQTIALVAAGAPCGVLPGGTGAAYKFTSYAACQGSGACIKATATAPTGTCAAPAADGAACDSDITVGPPCLAGAKCVPSGDGGTAGTCTVPNATTCH